MPQAEREQGPRGILATGPVLAWKLQTLLDLNPVASGGKSVCPMFIELERNGNKLSLYLHSTAPDMGPLPTSSHLLGPSEGSAWPVPPLEVQCGYAGPICQVSRTLLTPTPASLSALTQAVGLRHSEENLTLFVLLKQLLQMLQTPKDSRKTTK